MIRWIFYWRIYYFGRHAKRNAAPGTIIRFSKPVFPPTTPTKIEIFSGLPSLDDGAVTIDASNAGVILDGGNLTRNTGMPSLGINSNNNLVMGLQIINCPGSGVIIADGAQNNVSTVCTPLL
jgi:hypothetical protein